MSTLYAAHNQWASRPADETFDSIEAMHEACGAYKAQAAQATVPVASLRLEAVGDDLQLVGRTGTPAKIAHWAFGQLAQRAEAPAAYLRGLPATLAAQNLNHGLAKYSKAVASGDEEARNARLLLHQNGGLTLRALTSERYSRIWNVDITSRLVALRQEQPHWTMPLAYKRAPGSKGFEGLTGEMVPRGAYASDHDMFAFLVDGEKRVSADGTKDGLMRGFYVSNSEVGAASFSITAFLCDYVCGNHYIWGARDVLEVRIRHIGDASVRAWHQLGYELRRYTESSTAKMEETIRKARIMELGSTKDEVLDALLGRRIPELNRKRLDEAYEIAASEPRYGSPRTVWGMVSGLTELAQKTTYTDQRVSMDRASGKILEICF